MSQSNEMRKEIKVDVPAVLAVITQLGTLSASLNQMTTQMQNGSDLSWTGGDQSGVALWQQLAPAEQYGIKAVTDTKGAVDSIINSLGTTVGLWKNTEGTNIELNR